MVTQPTDAEILHRSQEMLVLIGSKIKKEKIFPAFYGLHSSISCKWLIFRERVICCPVLCTL